jgi:predicted dehydrogenase
MARFAVIGAGIWGRMHIRAYAQHPPAELVAICDIDEDRAREAASEFGVPKVFTDIDELLEEDLDGVSVVTPDPLHTEIVLKAADRGLHILVEKPLATNVEECRRMVEKTDDAGVILMVDWHNRWNPPYHHAQKSIREGELGDIRYIYYRLSNTTYVPMEMLPWAGHSSVMWFLGSHSLDTTCWLMGKEPKRVFCQRREGVLHSKGVQTPDLFVTHLDFADGALAVVENLWILPRSAPSIIDHKCEIVGTEGVIYLDPTHHRISAKYSARTAQDMPERSFEDMLITPEIHGRQMGFAVESIYHFIDCVETGATPLATGRDGLLNTRLIRGALKSAEIGSPVELDSI